MQATNFTQSTITPTDTAAMLAKLDEIKHRYRVREQLILCGLSKSGLRSAESRYLPKIIYPNESIGGVVYGYNAEGLAMLVATDQRVIYLDVKPMFTNEDEVNYFVVSGVQVSHAGMTTQITLHTRVRDFIFKTFNQKSANIFAQFIEAKFIQANNQSQTAVGDVGMGEE